jgi:hypothetical protein
MLNVVGAIVGLPLLLAAAILALTGLNKFRSHKGANNTL